MSEYQELKFVYYFLCILLLFHETGLYLPQCTMRDFYLNLTCYYKGSGAEYTHGRRVKATNPGMQPDVGGKTKPKSQGKMDKGTRADLMYRKANLKKEEVSDWRKDVLSEEEYDHWRDKQLEKYGSGWRGHSRRRTTARSGGTQPKPMPQKGKTVMQKETEKKYGKGKSALDIVKADIEKKHGKGAIMDTKKKKD